MAQSASTSKRKTSVNGSRDGNGGGGNGFQQAFKNIDDH